MTQPARPYRLLILFLCLLPPLLSGCGTSTNQSNSPAYPNISGNWKFSVSLPFPPNFSSNQIEGLSGALNSSGQNISGVLRARPLSLLSPCVAGDTDIPVTGTVDQYGNFSLSGPISGGTASINTTLTASANPLRPPVITGTLVVTGGTCVQSSMSLTAFQVPNVTGTFQGTLNQIFPIPTGTPQTIDVTANFVQSVSPDLHGLYPLTGSISSTGSCLITLTFNSGVVSGDSVDSFPMIYPVGTVPLSTLSFMGFATSGTLMFADINDPPGCPAISYSGVLTRQ